MEGEDWKQYLDYFCDGRVVKRTTSNTQVRALQVHQSRHGRESFSQYQFTNINENGELPSVIEQFRTMHSADGVFTNPDLEEQYHRMVDMRTEQAESLNPISDKEIILDVLGPRRGHVRGVGRVVAGASTSTSASNARSSPTERYYSQTEVDNMTSEIEARVEARIEERMRSVAAEAVREALLGSGLPFNPQSFDFRQTRDGELND